MSIFTAYESKPITRYAHKITESDIISQNPDGSYYLMSRGETVLFHSHIPVQTGGYVVKLSDDDTYYCSAEVFAERNIIPDSE